MEKAAAATDWKLTDRPVLAYPTVRDEEAGERVKLARQKTAQADSTSHRRTLRRSIRPKQPTKSLRASLRSTCDRPTHPGSKFGARGALTFVAILTSLRALLDPPHS